MQKFPDAVPENIAVIMLFVPFADNLAHMEAIILNIPIKIFTIVIGVALHPEVPVALRGDYLCNTGLT
jgi:hypothetical protein